MKPIELVSRAVLNSSNVGDKVLDLFGGSGSTLISCEQTNRINYSMELDPQYCQIIINRWEEYTNETATKIN
jgi:DNA modification methylase